MKYRSEIDGLRAIAVLPVIFFHAGFSIFKGGFVGVDIFFVISGYLITSIILEEMQDNRFSLLNFYERRARRILPPLFFMMICCLPLAWAWLTPGNMKDFAQSLIAVSIFSSNILFWRESGYFDVAAELKPLLHTWSLSVEEQFYILFPLFLIVAWRLGLKFITMLLVIGFLSSLGLAQWAVYNKPSAAFFLLPTRGWEILLGAFCAFYLRKPYINHSRYLNEFMSSLGLVLIGISVFTFNTTTPMPSLYTLIPTIGAVFLIIFARAGTLIQNILSFKPLVVLGLISYSAYLWHQPLFVFARHQNYLEPLDQITIVLLIMLTFFLAYFSWLYIEKPFRDKTKFSRRFIFLSSVIGLISFLIIGFVILKNNSYRERMDIPPNVQWASLAERLNIEGDVCTLVENTRYKGIKTCEFGDTHSDKILVLYGDSHAQAISKALDYEARQQGLKIIKTELKDCEVIFDITSRSGVDLQIHYKDCNRAFASLQKLIDDTNASTWLVTRWMFQYFPTPSVIEELNFDNGVGGIERDLSFRENFVMRSDGSRSLEAEPKKEATIKLLRGLLKVSENVYVTYPIPETGWDIFQENLKYYHHNHKFLDSLEYPYDRYKERNRFILDILDQELPKNTRYRSIRADHLFCEQLKTEFCVAQIDTIPLYYDDDHLSDEGSKILVDELFIKMKN